MDARQAAVASAWEAYSSAAAEPVRAMLVVALLPEMACSFADLHVADNPVQAVVAYVAAMQPVVKQSVPRHCFVFDLSSPVVLPFAVALFFSPQAVASR